MRTAAKARKITILPSTITNLRILSKSSFKNTHLGVSSPASVADTLQNKKKEQNWQDGSLSFISLVKVKTKMVLSSGRNRDQ